MDADEIVRARRRQQASEAVEFERDRQAAVAAQIEDVLTALEGSRIDEAAFARMAPEDVALVREVLSPGEDEPEDEFDLEFAPESAEEIRREREEERIRLEAVIADSQARQQALERYLKALEPQAPLPAEPAG